MVIPQRERERESERELCFIALAGELILPELLFQFMAFPVHWRDRSVGWGCMSYDGFACMHVCQDGWIIQPLLCPEEKTALAIDRLQSIDLFAARSVIAVPSHSSCLNVMPKCCGYNIY